MPDRTLQVLTELLVLRAQGGQDDAVGLLVHAWHDRLLRHAQRMAGHDEAGRDVMQEAWLDIVRGLIQLDDPSRFGPWAYRIVTRRCARWIGGEQRRRQVEQDSQTHRGGESDASASGEAGDDADAVRVALRRMPAEQRAILELRYVENYGIAEIAEALGVAVGTVKSRLFHARQHLREIFTKVTQ